jgi:GTPase-associated protein 1, N-terminal domain type 2/GTPase-associated protein 1, middle domain
MTADEGFGRLLYTDCGAAGFQVQARSPNVNSAMSELALGQLLYEVQVPWLTEKRPAEDFPLGFAHAGDAGYGTAQGRYLGMTVTGGRAGNHLTDCLLTSDPDLYGTLRPAQLWRSELWRPTSWPARECPSLPADDLTGGPLNVTAVADWARALTPRAQALARLLTVLEDANGRRVVIVSDDPDEAMTWIAAATLLLPAREALRVSFKVFSSIPLRAGHRIAAAPAVLFPRIALGQDGPFVLDARSGTADEGPVSERAAFFTAKLTADGDPYDVIDAVELAAMLDRPAAESRPGGHDARVTV